MNYKQEFYDQLGHAIALATTLFDGKKDKQGRPYILHCLRVMNSMGDDPEVQVVAILHDVMEDIEEYDIERLRDKLFLTLRQEKALLLLTRKEDIPYDEYIHKIATNEDARKIKIADLIDNSNITRLKGLRKKDFDRLEKYHRAFVYLSN